MLGPCPTEKTVAELTGTRQNLACVQCSIDADSISVTDFFGPVSVLLESITAMQLLRFEFAESANENLSESWGVRTSDGIRDIGGLLGSCRTLSDAILQWESLQPQLDVLMADAPLLSNDTRLLCPIPEGGKVLCIGLNYRDHAIETGAEIPSEPVVFCKLPGALCGPEDDVPLPAVSRQVDYEAELVIVIGRETWQVTEDQADDAIFGYMCGHDVSARDWQKGRPGGQWLLGKSFPNFAPAGPYLVPKQFVPDPGNLGIRLTLNGETLQESSTSQLIFNPWQLIAYLSKCCVLKPGDIIFTGTPPGVGAARTPPRFLQPGDECSVTIDGLGTLRNRFVQGD